MEFSKFFKKRVGYSFSLFEAILAISLCLVTAWLLLVNLKHSRERGYEQSARSAYDKIKQAVYEEMSSPGAAQRYLMKNFIGPATLPSPLNEVFLDKGQELNYLIRVHQRSKKGRSREQLRFEVTHAQGKYIYRYTEVNGLLLEQLIEKENVDD